MKILISILFDCFTKDFFLFGGFVFVQNVESGSVAFPVVFASANQGVQVFIHVGLRPE